MLDWLAVDFMEHGWSHKHLIETIVTSETYQQSSPSTPAMLERDPRNRYLARGPRFRMDAEVIRDMTLSIAGLLHLKEIGGPSIFPPVPQSMLDYNFFKPTYWVPPEGPERYRRALYVVRKRSMPDPVLMSFDAPNGGHCLCASAALEHAAFGVDQPERDHVRRSRAGPGALRVLKEGGKDDGCPRRLCLLAMHLRLAKPAELRKSSSCWQRIEIDCAAANSRPARSPSRDSQSPKTCRADATPNDIAAWTIVGRVLLNLDETMTKSLCRILECDEEENMNALTSWEIGLARASLITRRWFLRDCGVGLAGIAATSLFAQEAAGCSAAAWAPGPHFPPKAKSVIYLFQAGAPAIWSCSISSPSSPGNDGRLPPAELLKGYRAAFINPNSALLGPKYRFARHGRSGMEISEMLPHTGAASWTTSVSSARCRPRR